MALVIESSKSAVSKLGGSCCVRRFVRWREKFNPDTYGGAYLLGLAGWR